MLKRMSCHQLSISIVILFVASGLQAQEFLLGVDLSYVNEMEDCGAVYYEEGNPKDPYTIFSDLGTEVVRLRLWHQPEWTDYSKLADVKKSMARAKSLNLKVLLDIHYSDVWADPSRQWRPLAWNAITDDQILADSVYNYTLKVLNTLAAEDLEPDFVQVGNEINGNLLLPFDADTISDESSSSALYPVQWERQVALLNAGLEALADFNLANSSAIRSVLHIAQPENARSWFTSATQNGIDPFDIIGLSYYPSWSSLSIREASREIQDLKNDFNKEVLIVEIGYPWTTNNNDSAPNVIGTDNDIVKTYGAPTPSVQRELLTEWTALVKQNGGLGVIYWEPAWVSTSCRTLWAQGSHGDHTALFDFDNTLHEGSYFLSYDYNVWPDALQMKTVTLQVNLQNVNFLDDPTVTIEADGEQSTISMTLIEKALYEATFDLPGRSIARYRFEVVGLDDQVQQEKIPGSCALQGNWRELIVRDENTTSSVAWSSCDEEVVVTQLNAPSHSHNDLMVYPNPLQDWVYIRSKREPGQIRIHDLTGRDWPFELYPDARKIRLNLSHLPQGTYVLLWEEGHQTKVKTIIKK